MKIPTTVVTGSLGAGKTTLILNLVKQLPQDYKTLWLKNEYGDVNVDSELARGTNISTREILNGCICCVLIGKLHNALEEIVATMQVDRLIIETAGTAYPYPIVAEVIDTPGLQLDGLVTVVDALNFDQFHDKSALAKSQSKYVDLVVINKVGLVDAAQREHVWDEVYDLYLDSPKVETSDGVVSAELLIGLDSRLASMTELPPNNHDHHEHSAAHTHVDNVEVFSWQFPDTTFSQDKLTELLEQLHQQEFYRIKGIIHTERGPQVLNYVVGKFTWQALPNYTGSTKVTFMGKGILHQEAAIGRQWQLAQI